MTAKAKAKYVATRGVSWRVGDGWANREAGDDVSDAPADVLEALKSKASPAAVTAEEWAAQQEATNGEA